MPEAISRRLVQTLRRGMFRATGQVPPDAAYDIVGLLDIDGLPYGRGGSELIDATHPMAAPILGLWQGVLVGGERTLVWSTGSPPNQTATLSAGALTIESLPAGTIVGHPPAVLNGVAYFGSGIKWDGTTWSLEATALGGFMVAAGSRMWKLSGRRASFSGLNTATTYDPTDYHELPDGVNLLWGVGFRDSIMLFTTGGVFRVSNITQPLTDVDGNVLHRVDLITRDVVLYNEAGITAYEDSLVLAAVDGVWMIRAGVDSEVAAPFEKISGPIDSLYRELMASSIADVGQAAVFNGHLLLPVQTLDVDDPWESGDDNPWEVLVCRLDSPLRPWTRLSGLGADVRALLRAHDDLGAPLLLAGATSGHVTTADYFGTTAGDESSLAGELSRAVPFSVTSADMATGSLNPNTVVKARLTYELSGSATLTASVEADGAVAALTGSASASPPDSTARFTWPVRERARFARITLLSAGEYAMVKMRALEVFVRDAGRV